MTALAFARAAVRWLHPRRQRLLLAAAALLPATRVGLRLLPLLAVQGRLERLARLALAGCHDFTPQEVARAVRFTGRHVPGGQHCLTAAAVAQALLAVAGHSSRLELGVRRGDGAIEAHAWVVCGGKTIVGDRDDLASFAPFDRRAQGRARW